MITALQISIVPMVGGVIFDSLPNEKIREIVRDTRIFSLRLIGRNTSGLTAAFVAAGLSATAGFAEELFFRGLLFGVIQHYLGTPSAVLLSSGIFGYY